MSNDDRPLVLHVMHRFATGGLENGVVNLLNHMPQEAYRHAVETSVYLDPHSLGRGLGTALSTRLLERLRQAPIHAVISGIALPNPASVRLHEGLGMRKVIGWPDRKRHEAGRELQSIHGRGQSPRQ